MSSLMFVKLVGPPLEMFQPLPYVKSWLSKGHHAATDLNSLSRKQQQEISALDNSVLWNILAK